VDIIPRIVWWVILHDVVDAGDIEPSRCDICTKQDPGLGIDEFEERIRPFLLFLFTLLDASYLMKKKE
jgi:hypothetical protein